MTGLLGGLAEWLRPAHDHVCEHCGHVSTTGLWLMIGFLGQAIFTARFLAQWAASEKKKKSVVPVVFWWLSLAGGLVLLTYAAHRNDPVIVVGQSLGVVVYIRNLMLSGRAARTQQPPILRAQPAPAADPSLTVSEGPEARAA
ncbi:MAG TPA: lipid-A-disaccharide synthase N-terminal domain-containing protein [Isosphaeraceae bacterium]|nr:lipid-A-disaccharide synthase N-terminal domain-containing protein [Isosphaeraceae bacterium]